MFHYHNKHIRAVSTVTHEFTNYPRTAAYEAREGEGNIGWLVRVKPIRTDLSLHFSRVAELIKIGMPGPLNKAKRPIPQQGRYISVLTDEDGQRLLKALGLTPPLADEGLFGRPTDYWDGDETDSSIISTLRKEQDQLRRALLSGRDTAPCAICGRLFHKRMLIAGHIKPRSKCSEEERRQFRKVAMLICALGCDALFEWGYIVVKEDGKIGSGREADTTDLRRLVDPLLGKKCNAYSPETAPSFAAHVKLHSLWLGEHSQTFAL